METANIERGEIMVALEGVDHVLRPSYEAQVAIEAQTGRSIEQLAAAAGENALTIGEAAIIVTECIRAQGRAVNDKTLMRYEPGRVGECIVTSGKLAIVRRLELLLYLAATGGYLASGEVAAPLALPAAGLKPDGADIAA